MDKEYEYVVSEFNSYSREAKNLIVCSTQKEVLNFTAKYAEESMLKNLQGINVEKPAGLAISLKVEKVEKYASS